MGCLSKGKVREPYCRTEGPTESCFLFLFYFFKIGWRNLGDKNKDSILRFACFHATSIVFIYEKKETSTKAVNIESVVKSCTNVDNQAPEFLTIEERNKKSVLDEIQRQKDRIGNLEKKNN